MTDEMLIGGLIFDAAAVEPDGLNLRRLVGL